MTDEVKPYTGIPEPGYLHAIAAAEAAAQRLKDLQFSPAFSIDRHGDVYTMCLLCCAVVPVRPPLGAWEVGYPPETHRGRCS